MKPYLKPILVSLLFAVLLILSSLLVKEKTARDLAHIIIYTAWAYFFYRSFAAKKHCAISTAKG